jgi:hypothetical protein
LDRDCFCIGRRTDRWIGLFVDVYNLVRWFIAGIILDQITGGNELCIKAGLVEMVEVVEMFAALISKRYFLGSSKLLSGDYLI